MSRVDDTRLVQFLGFKYVRVGAIRQLTFRGRWLFVAFDTTWKLHFFKKVSTGERP